MLIEQRAIENPEINIPQNTTLRLPVLASVERHGPYPIDLINRAVRSGWGGKIPIDSPEHEEALCLAWEIWHLCHPRLLKKVARVRFEIDPIDGTRSLRISLKGGIA